jgi:hypothetical protein
MNHSPGTWEVSNTGRCFIRSNRNFKAICEVESYEVDPARVAANAALIAAAPELLHACLATLGFLGGVSILSKEQLQTLLADTLKKAGVNAKWSSG